MTRNMWVTSATNEPVLQKQVELGVLGRQCYSSITVICHLFQVLKRLGVVIVCVALSRCGTTLALKHFVLDL